MPKKFVRICPRCKSTDVSSDLSIQAYGKGSFFNEYKCNKCGTQDSFFQK